MATQTPSEACCTVPPAQHEYKEKGSYIDVQGMKTYTYGPSSASTAILIVFDIFGFFPQTLQGADLLATADGSHQRRVFMPDWFDGKPFPVESFPPATDEQKKALGDFFAGPANLEKVVGKIPAFIKEIEAKAENGSNIKNWGILGFCWGGKVVSLSSQSGTPFSAAAVCHPAMIDPEDAKKITIPIAVLPSGDEDAKDVSAFKSSLSVPNVVETFSDQVHGWMAARADLKSSRVKEEYERGYRTLLEFYQKHL